MKATLIPVPVGTKIQDWHWWLTPELNMSEGERVVYFGRSRAGKRLKQAGQLFYVRIERAPKALADGKEVG